jgi:hypothetical protein
VIEPVEIDCEENNQEINDIAGNQQLSQNEIIKLRETSLLEVYP